MIKHHCWIQTYSGVAFDLWDPKPEMVKLEDIAHHLSLLCRFTGAVKEFYSVAEHCLIVSRHLPDELKLAGLLHDAAEAFCGDVSSPLKGAMRSLAEQEECPEQYQWVYRTVECTIASRFLDGHAGLFRHKKVIEADLRALATEKRDLLGPEPQPWTINWKKYPPFEKVRPWLDIDNGIESPMRPDEARYEYIQEAKRLGIPE